MAFVAFLRGMNVGGCRRLRPTLLAQELSRYGVVNVGAAGTLVVLKPVPRVKFLAELRKRLPFSADIVTCDARDILRLVDESPFLEEVRPELTPFVSILAKTPRGTRSLPIHIPPEGEWCVRILAVRGRFVIGEYRRRMKTIACLGQIDRMFGSRATTRNWNTVRAIARVLQDKH